jgi:hypothetical protein
MYDKRDRGDAGPMSVARWPVYNKDGKRIRVEEEADARPRVGVAMRVGTYFARSYSAQDWWQTTLIKEIVKDTPEEVVFRTQSGSEYTWKII